MLSHLWDDLKRWRRLRAGPVTLHFGFRKTVRVRHSRRHDIRGARSSPVKAGAGPEKGEAPYRKETGLALIVGVGPGLGREVAVRLAHRGMTVVVVSRDGSNHDGTVQEVREHGGAIHSYACDATDERSVERMFATLRDRMGIPSLVVYSVQWFARNPCIAVSAAEFEDSWRHNCFGPFLVAREAARLMVSNEHRGTLVLIGSTSSTVGREEHLSFASAKFGLRAASQVLARELWPRGIHVAHLLIDADIREAGPEKHPQSEPAHIAESILFLHRQPHTAWTSEMDLRPSNEKFWEHC